MVLLTHINIILLTTSLFEPTEQTQPKYEVLSELSVKRSEEPSECVSGLKRSLHETILKAYKHTGKKNKQLILIMGSSLECPTSAAYWWVCHYWRFPLLPVVFTPLETPFTQLWGKVLLWYLHTECINYGIYIVYFGKDVVFFNI